MNGLGSQGWASGDDIYFLVVERAVNKTLHGEEEYTRTSDPFLRVESSAKAYLVLSSVRFRAAR